ncbi:MAG: 23S rRNA (adenine2030-N6)-methyltransferase [Alphaproteobacteria bacterium]|jgi:23S rRNA (adenine2030-N6)-methyltransferase
MNYQHIYHAGNFADVLKHIILLETLKGLQVAKRPIFILDTHAGRGRYNLKSMEAHRSGEFHEGIGHLFNQPTNQLPETVMHYINAVKQENKSGDLVYYPGSPFFIKQSLRPQDRAAFCELNEKEFFKLHALMHQQKNIKLVHGDGYEALMSFMPPREKTGLVLIDPPFEQRDEILTLENAIINALKRWPNGTFMLWYPVKEPEKFNKHFNVLKNTNVPSLLFELEIPNNAPLTTPSITQNGLRKTAIIVLNPPQNLIDKQHDMHGLNKILFSKTNAPAL